MKFGIAILLLTITGIKTSGNQATQHFDRSGFYAAMASENTEQINASLLAVETVDFTNKDAFEGALLMKKAGLATNSKNKLNLFKSGRKKLESSVSNDYKNAELRFLRLMVQENAPKILNYHSNINEDSQFIRKFYNSLLPVVQEAVSDYSKKSKVLHLDFF